MRPIEIAVAIAIAGILLPVGVTAVLSAPNSFDTLAYHMPRVVYWAQASSVEFFPTSYLAQISFPPLAEYLMLHSYLMSGGDHFVNLVSWIAFAAGILGASAIAGTLGASARAQCIGALFCATLPGAILQASGPKNDLLLALWLVCAMYFGLRGNIIMCGPVVRISARYQRNSICFCFPAAPLVGLVLEAMRPQIVALVICLFLLDGARLPVLENWTRPLRGQQSVLEIDRNANYFADIGSMNNRHSYLEAVNLVARSGCDIVGIDASRTQLEYPFQALLLQRNAAVRFWHVGVENSSQRYSKSDEPQPCAVLCLDCAGDERKTAAYRGIGPVTTVGRFLLFLKHLI